MLITEALIWHASQRPDARAFSFLGDGEQVTDCISFGELSDRVRALAVDIRKRHRTAERALILHQPGLDFIVSLCACFVAGVTAVPSPLPAVRVNSRTSDRFSSLLADAAPDIVLSHSIHLARMRWVTRFGSGISEKNWVATDISGIEDEDCDVAMLSAATSDQDALIQYTSGSTTKPKGVVISHANLAHNLSVIAQKFSLTSGSVVVNWLPPFHDMGLIGGILEGIWSGYHTVLMDPKHFLQRPMRWLESISRFSADVSGGANFAFDLCCDAMARTPDNDLDLSRWRLAFSGAEPVRASTIRRFSDTFSDSGFRHEAFYPCYGLAEATLIASGPEPDAKRPVILTVDAEALLSGEAVVVSAGEPHIRELVSCGSAGADSGISIVDPDSGQLCADGKIGEIWLTGPDIMKGYRNRSAGTTTAALSTLPGQLEPRFFATGDIGFLMEGGLFVTGRYKDIIIIRGKNHAAVDIEDATSISHPALLLNGIAAFGHDDGVAEGLVLACELRREAVRKARPSELFAAIREKLSAEVGVTPHDILLLKPGALPRTTSGKIQRALCRQTYQSGDWHVLASLQTVGSAKSLPAEAISSSPSAEPELTTIEDRLGDLLAETTAVSRTFMSRNSTLSSTGIDSLKLIEFSLRLEQEYHRVIQIDWLQPETTLKDLARLIRDDESSAPALARTADDAEQIVPLSPRQERFLSAGVSNPEAFIEVLLLRTPPDLDRKALQAALQQLARSHDAFALRFRQGKTGWVQEYDPTGELIGFEEVDASDLSQSDVAGLRDNILNRLKAETDFDRGPLAKMFLIWRGEGQRGVLIAGFHHLIIDAVSLSVWVTQLNGTYQIACRESSPDHPVMVESFRHWLRNLDSYAASEAVCGQLSYWQDVCGIDTGSDTSSGLKVPIQPAKDRTWRFAGARELAPVKNMELLQKYQTGAERTCLMLAALGWAWRQETGESDLLVKLESHGRMAFEQANPFSSIGWFASQYPFRASCPPDASSDQLIARMLHHLGTVPDFGLGYDLLRLGRCGLVARDVMKTLRKPKVSLQFRGGIDEAFRSNDVLPVIGTIHDTTVWKELARLENEPGVLHMSAGLRKNTLQWSFVAASDLSDDLAERLLNNVESFLERLET